MIENKLITVGDLKALLTDVPDYVWVCLKDGPLQTIEKELGAAEPFLLLRAMEKCLHGVPSNEKCAACEHVRGLMVDG